MGDIFIGEADLLIDFINQPTEAGSQNDADFRDRLYIFLNIGYRFRNLCAQLAHGGSVTISRRVSGVVGLFSLDLHSYREVSNETSYKFKVMHQSPQLLIIRNGMLVADASHGSINAIDLNTFK